MSDLIKREDVLKQIWEWVTNREFNYTNATHWLQKRIEAIPTIDAVEVVRGEWIPFDQSWGREVWYCTACETAMNVPTRMGKPMYDYCPYCGARMKGADNE